MTATQYVRGGIMELDRGVLLFPAELSYTTACNRLEADAAAALYAPLPTGLSSTVLEFTVPLHGVRDGLLDLVTGGMVTARADAAAAARWADDGGVL